MTSRGPAQQEQAIVEPTVIDNGINDDDEKHEAEEGCEIRPMEAILTELMPSTSLCMPKPNWQERESFENSNAHSLTDQGLQTRAHTMQQKNGRSSPADRKDEKRDKDK